MRFSITASSDWNKPEDILYEHALLNKYNFNVEEKSRYPHYKEATIEIKSFEELIDFVETMEYPIILSTCVSPNADYEIEIYDGYRE